MLVIVCPEGQPWKTPPRRNPKRKRRLRLSMSGGVSASGGRRPVTALSRFVAAKLTRTAWAAASPPLRVRGASERIHVERHGDGHEEAADERRARWRRGDKLSLRRAAQAWTSASTPDSISSQVAPTAPMWVRPFWPL